MNFYLMFYQLLENVERIEAGAGYLAAHANRISPRDGQANRELLEECGKKLREVKKLMGVKSHVSKVHLRRTATIFQALDLAHRRVLNLSGVSNPSGDDGDDFWEIFSRSRQDYALLADLLSARMGFPILAPVHPLEPIESLAAIAQRERRLRDELIRSIEKGIEIFDEERELTEKLIVVRKSLLESKKYTKRLLVGHFEPTIQSSLPHEKTGAEEPIHSLETRESVAMR